MSTQVRKKAEAQKVPSRDNGKAAPLSVTGPDEFAPPRWGNTFYWAATVIAVLIVAWDMWGYTYASNVGEPVVRLAPFLLAGLIWLIGFFCRSIARRS